MSTGRTTSVPPLGRRPRIAAVLVDYGLRRHSDNLVTRLLEGYWINDDFHPPFCDVVSVYVHRNTETYPDLSRRLSLAYGFAICPTIPSALTLDTGSLAVDGVVIVSEDGLLPWPKNPFFLFFSEVAGVFRRCGRAVPVFNDKALSHDWDEAQWMARQARRLNFPLMAGSITPVTFRRPELNLPLGGRITEGVVVLPISPAAVESYAFHGLELLQAMLERRAGGETGVRGVRVLRDAEVWAAGEAGEWSRELFDAAVARSSSRSEGRPERLVAHPIALQVDYADGTRGTVIGAAGLVRDFCFAGAIGDAGAIASTLAYWPRENSNSFSCLVHRFRQMLETGTSPSPIARTVLTCGMLDFSMRAARAGSAWLETPALHSFAYAPTADPGFCPGPGS